MDNQLESCLILDLEPIVWSAAWPPAYGTLPFPDPNGPMDPVPYSLRDRVLQHRDMINTVAIVKAGVHARAVWNGSTDVPIVQGVTGVFDQTGNVDLPFNAWEAGAVPITSSAVIHVGQSSVAWDSLRLTDPGLYDRDLLIYETVARAALIFPEPPLEVLNPAKDKIQPPTAWSKAEGVNVAVTPNSALPLSRDLFKQPDQYLANRDNQVAAYASRLVQALKNPFAFATRLYVAVSGPGARESETYVLTDSLFDSAITYAAGDEVLYLDVWYSAVYTTNTVPSATNHAWTILTDGPTKRQFLADPSLSSRNKIVYNTVAQTLQWFREDLETVHVPQIIGLSIPGVLPNQWVNTVPSVPDRTDSQFWREKAGRVSVSSGTLAYQFGINPTGGSPTDGSMDTLFQSAKALTLAVPQIATIHFNPLSLAPGNYLATLLVRPASQMLLLGTDRVSGGTPVADGLNCSLGNPVSYKVDFPAGAWKAYLDYANWNDPANADSFGFAVRVTLDSTPVMLDALPLPYTDENGHPLPKGTVLRSPAIELAPHTKSYMFNVNWTAGQGTFQLKQVLFVCADTQTGHYAMTASMAGVTARLDVIGQRDVPDVMPFLFNVTTASTNPDMTLAWNARSAATFDSNRDYQQGDQVSYDKENVGSAYWEALLPIPRGQPDPPANPNWSLLAIEPQLPLLVEQVSLHQLVTTPVTPFTVGFQGFRQDMVERAIRCDQDFYRQTIATFGTYYPEFRAFGTATWTLDSTGTWMRLQESHNPRLRQMDNVLSGGIVMDRYYEVVGDPVSSTIVYNGTTYHGGDHFYGVSSQNSFTATGGATLRQVGAYILATPGDVGQPALIPAGLEFVQAAGTIAAHYASYASLPSIVALQPWMVEAGFYVAQPEFWSPSTLSG
jgi:hypothetical protein